MSQKNRRYMYDKLVKAKRDIPEVLLKEFGLPEELITKTPKEETKKKVK